MQSSDRFPLTAARNHHRSVCVADWRAQTKFLITSAALSALVIAGVLLLIVRRLWQHRVSRLQLALERGAFIPPSTICLRAFCFTMLTSGSSSAISAISTCQVVVRHRQAGPHVQELLIHRKDKRLIFGRCRRVLRPDAGCCGREMPTQHSYQPGDGKRFRLPISHSKAAAG